MLQNKDLSFTKKREKAVRGFRVGKNGQVGEKIDVTLLTRSQLSDFSNMPKTVNSHKSRKKYI